MTDWTTLTLDRLKEALATATYDSHNAYRKRQAADTEIEKAQARGRAIVEEMFRREKL